jgi:hypothetical protein
LPAPPLAITTLSGSPVLLYPTTATNYILQVTTNLLSGNWTAVTSGIPFTGIMVTNAAPNSFFRLSHQ